MPFPSTNDSGSLVEAFLNLGDQEDTILGTNDDGSLPPLTRPNDDVSGFNESIKVQCLKSKYENTANGCGQWSSFLQNISATAPATSGLCWSCGNRLLSVSSNGHGHRLFLGLTVYFCRTSSMSILDKGTVVYLPTNPNKATVTIKYSEVTYRNDKYDQIRFQKDVLTESELADSGRGKRSRRAAVGTPEVAATPAPAHRLITSELNSCPLVFTDSPLSVTNLVQTEIQTGGALIIDSQTSEEDARRRRRRQNDASFARSANTELESKVPEKTAVVLCGAISRENVSGNSSFNSEHSCRFDDFSPHQLVHKLYPASAYTGTTSGVRGLDRYIRRGLLHAVWHYLKPPDRSNSNNTRFSESVTVGQLHELLTVCPTNIDQMRNRMIMPLCASLLNVKSPNSFALAEVIATPSSLSLGEGLVHVVKSYLSERGFDVAGNIGLQQCFPTLPGTPQLRCRDSPSISDDCFEEGNSMEVRSEVDSSVLCPLSLPLSITLPRGLSIPLSHDHFVIALDLAFGRLGGREAFENRKGVRGLDYIAPDNAAPSSSSASSPSARGYQKKKIAPRIGAMYGAMNPLFIEDCVVQPSRLGKSGDFLDIGSGIGQVVVQVAATVGCKAIGMEISPARHDAAKELLDALEIVLDESGMLCDSEHPSLRSLVDLKLMDFCSEKGSEIVKNAEVIFFNNFGPWFEPLVSTFHEQLLHKSKGAQIFVLNPLIEVGRWAHVCTFQTGREACTWSDLDNPVYHYSILDDLKMWTCLWCTLDNPVGIEECQICGKKGKATRMKGSKRSLR